MFISGAVLRLSSFIRLKTMIKTFCTKTFFRTDSCPPIFRYCLTNLCIFLMQSLFSTNLHRAARRRVLTRRGFDITSDGILHELKRRKLGDRRFNH